MVSTQQSSCYQHHNTNFSSSSFFFFVHLRLFLGRVFMLESNNCYFLFQDPNPQALKFLILKFI